jgi:hypothetical protein
LASRQFTKYLASKWPTILSIVYSFPHSIHSGIEASHQQTCRQMSNYLAPSCTHRRLWVQLSNECSFFHHFWWSFRVQGPTTKNKVVWYEQSERRSSIENEITKDSGMVCVCVR